MTKGLSIRQSQYHTLHSYSRVVPSFELETRFFERIGPYLHVSLGKQCSAVHMQTIRSTFAVVFPSGLHPLPSRFFFAYDMATVRKEVLHTYM